MKLTADYLYDEYVNKEKAMGEIAKEVGVSPATVHKYIKVYGIKARPKMTEKTKKKIGDAQKGRESIRKGVTLSDETKKRISDAHNGVFRIHSQFGGHVKRRSDGYISVYLPDHPRANKDGYVMEHVLIMEQQIVRYLAGNEVVHHINRIRSDNRIENLLLMDKQEHAKMHTLERHKTQRIFKKEVMTY